MSERRTCGIFLSCVPIMCDINLGLRTLLVSPYRLRNHQLMYSGPYWVLLDGYFTYLQNVPVIIMGAVPRHRSCYFEKEAACHLFRNSCKANIWDPLVSCPSDVSPFCLVFQRRRKYFMYAQNKDQLIEYILALSQRSRNEGFYRLI